MISLFYCRFHPFVIFFVVVAAKNNTVIPKRAFHSSYKHDPMWKCNQKVQHKVRNNQNDLKNVVFSLGITLKALARLQPLQLVDIQPHLLDVPSHRHSPAHTHTHIHSYNRTSDTEQERWFCERFVWSVYVGMHLRVSFGIHSNNVLSARGSDKGPGLFVLFKQSVYRVL